MYTYIKTPHLQERHDVVHHLPVPLVVKPPQLRDATQQLDQARSHVVRQPGPHAEQVVEDVVADLHPLRSREVVPVVRDESGQAARGQQQRVGVLRVVEDVLALRDPFRRGLQAQELVLRVAARGLIRGVVESFAEGLHLDQLSGVHGDWLVCWLVVEGRM